MLLSNGMVEHRPARISANANDSRTLAFIPSTRQRVQLSRSQPHGLYGPDSDIKHDCSLHLEADELARMLPNTKTFNKTVTDTLLSRSSYMTRVKIRGCVYEDICCERFIEALTSTSASGVLMHDLSEAVVQAVWQQCELFFCIEVCLPTYRKKIFYLSFCGWWRALGFERWDSSVWAPVCQHFGSEAKTAAVGVRRPLEIGISFKSFLHL